LFKNSSTDSLPSGLVVSGAPELFQLRGKLVLVHPSVLNSQLHLIQPLVSLRTVNQSIKQSINESLPAFSRSAIIRLSIKELSRQLPRMLNNKFNPIQPRMSLSRIHLSSTVQYCLNNPLNKICPQRIASFISCGAVGSQQKIKQPTNQKKAYLIQMPACESTDSQWVNQTIQKSITF
jgi:hypothetical protein